MATGSHIDAIPNAGKYDGVLGVLGAIEAIRALQAAGFQPKRSIEPIIFTSTEMIAVAKENSENNPPASKKRGP